uniref:Mannose-P-dolichol utilization defect 1 protein homolog n=1 Tax=Eutreptiella gymnastica TaxID=73025 RepID=A0A7S1NI11_9EUGL
MQLTDLTMEVLNGDFSKAAALISLLLSYAIVAGSFTLKLPQILKIMKSGSARGISLSMLQMELFGYAISALYNFGQGYDLSTYAENVVILFQNLALVVIVASYQKRIDLTLIVGMALFFLWVILTAVEAHPVLPSATWALMTFGNIPLFAFSRIPQIMTNFKTKDVGVTAVSGFILAWGGNIARIFTTLVEVNDPVILAGFCINAVLNGTIIVQCFMYGDRSEKKAQ